MKTSKNKHKLYKELLLVWPNVARIVAEAERYLDDLTMPGDDETFVWRCAHQAAKKASELKYTEGYTLKKLIAFCDEFQGCLLELEQVRVRRNGHVWDPDDRTFSEFLEKEGSYRVERRERPARHERFRELIEGWMRTHA